MPNRKNKLDLTNNSCKFRPAVQLFNRLAAMDHMKLSYLAIANVRKVF